MANLNHAVQGSNWNQIGLFMHLWIGKPREVRENGIPYVWQHQHQHQQQQKKRNECPNFYHPTLAEDKDVLDALQEDLASKWTLIVRVNMKN